MKYSVNRYHVKITLDGKSSLDNYYGYTSRKVAETRADEWRDLGWEAEVLDSQKGDKLYD